MRPVAELARFGALTPEVPFEAFVLVPDPLKNAHAPNSAFDEPASQQAIPRESAFLPGPVDTVLRVRLFCFPREFNQLGGRRLHPKRQLVRGDPGGDFRVLVLLLPELIQFADGVKLTAMRGRGDVVRRLQVQDRLPLIAEHDPLVHGREKAIAPRHLPRDWPAMIHQHDVSWQVP